MAILVVIPALFAGFMRLMGSTLRLLDQAGRREALLANVGFQLSGLTELSAVSAVIDRAAYDLCELNPGLVLLTLRAGREDSTIFGPDSWNRAASELSATGRDGRAVTSTGSAEDGAGPVVADPRRLPVAAGQVVVEAAYGLADPPIGVTLPQSWLDEVDPYRIGDAHHCPSTPALDALVGRRRSGWFAIGLGTQDAERYIVAAAPGRSVPEGILATMRTLSTQHSLAEGSCRAHAELTHLAMHDSLTGTPNQRTFYALLATAVTQAENANVALMIIDLDDFKQVNDTLGHHSGDELLIEVAERLRVAAGPGVAVSRFGGDEFALLLTGLTSQAQADEVAERVLARLQEPIRLSGGVVTVGGSVGLVGGMLNATAADLMRCADIAMYSAKAEGKSRIQRFSDHHHGKIAQVRLLEEQLVYVVARDEIVLHYQPLIDLKTGQCMGAEALARWQHPDLGLLLPNDFVPAAERRGLMVELQTHILRTACRQLRQWNDLDPLRGLRISVNVSSRLLLTPGFDRLIRDLLVETATPAAGLSLEFSESEMLTQELPRVQLAAIAEMGVRIALDDGGTNNVSLANLRALKPDQLKIDCRPLDRADTSAIEMMNLVMSVSRFLQLETVAKMIETPQHLERAREEGLTMGQGYFFGAPMPADAFSDWLAESRRELASDPIPFGSQAF